MTEGEKGEDADGGDVTPMTFMQRMNICGSCEHMKRGLKISRCQLCGCILAAKARKKNEHCPIKKW